MTDYTYSRRVAQLIQQLKDHPHRDEILVLVAESVADDTDVFTSTVD